MFWQSSAVIPAHTPGTDGASRAPHLRVSLVAHSASDFAGAAKTGQRGYEPEFYRLKGALLLQQSADNHAAAQACFQCALAVARSLRAKSFELRAATSLARLWQEQGKRATARELLVPIYSW